VNSVSKIDVWSACIDDKPGGLVAAIEDLELRGSLDLEFLLAERPAGQAGKENILLFPVGGERQQAIAQRAGLVRNDNVYYVRVTGTNEPGIAYRQLRALADHGLNLRTVSTAAIRNDYVMYVAFDTAEDANTAAKILLSPT
jgi:predicted amino acid-binding ACT domain protein